MTEEEKREKKTAYMRRWRAANSEKVREAYTQKYKAHRNEILTQKRLAYAANGDKQRAYQRDYYAKNSAQCKETNRRCIQKNMAMCREDGEHMRVARIQAGLTQRDVAAIFGVSQTLVFCWEHGQYPIRAGAIEKITEIAETEERMNEHGKRRKHDKGEAYRSGKSAAVCRFAKS